MPAFADFYDIALWVSAMDPGILYQRVDDRTARNCNRQ